VLNWQKMIHIRIVRTVSKVVRHSSVHWLVFGRPLQVTVRPMLSDRCLSCLSLSLVYCDQTVAWMMNQDATWYGGRPRHRRVCIRWGLNFPSPKGTAPPTFAVYGRKQICVRTLRPMSIVTKRLITGSSSMAGARTPPPGLGKDAVDCVESVDSQQSELTHSCWTDRQWVRRDRWPCSFFGPCLCGHGRPSTAELLSKDSRYTSGTGHGMHARNTTCKQKTLDVGKSVSLAQADGQHSSGCRALLW